MKFSIVISLLTVLLGLLSAAETNQTNSTNITATTVANTTSVTNSTNVTMAADKTISQNTMTEVKLPPFIPMVQLPHGTRLSARYDAFNDLV
jgi:hypothetical protein